MDEKITLANGREFHNTHVLESDDTLFVYINDEEETLKTVFDDLYDAEKTAEITAIRFGTEQTYTGYTTLVSVRRETFGQITAGLKKGA